MRLMLMSLAGILCLCGATLAEGGVTTYSVLLSSLKDIKDGSFMFNITTDTILKDIVNKTLFLTYIIDGTTIEAKIMIENKIHLLINDETVPIELPSHDTEVNLTKYNVNHLLRARGMNELRIRQFTFYKLHPETELINAHLHTIDTTRYFHLYLFERPRMNISGNSLLCSLNHTGIGEYENWLVKFFKEDETIGVCVKDDDSETDVYYDKNKHACVLKLDEEAVGTYSCSLYVRHVETGKKTLECPVKINIENTPKELPLLMIIVAGVCVGIMIILVIIVLPVIGIAKWRSRRPQVNDIEPNRDNADDNHNDDEEEEEEVPPRARGDRASLLGRQRQQASRSATSTPMTTMSEPEYEDSDDRRLDISSPNPNPPSLESNNRRPLKPPDGSSSGTTSPEGDQRPAASRERDRTHGTRVKGKKRRKKGARPQERKETEDKL